MTSGACLRGGGGVDERDDDEGNVGGVGDGNGVGDGKGAGRFLRRPPFHEEEAPADPPRFHFGAIHARDFKDEGRVYNRY